MADTAPEKDDLEQVIWSILSDIRAYCDDWRGTYGVLESTRERAFKSLLALWRMTQPETTSSTTEGDLQ